MPRPSNTKEISRIDHLLLPFCPKFLNIILPSLKIALQTHCFHWNSHCESTFLKLENEIWLIRYGLILPIMRTSDGSPIHIAAVLSYNIDGCEKPIFYVNSIRTPYLLNLQSTVFTIISTDEMLDLSQIMSCCQ